MTRFEVLGSLSVNSWVAIATIATIALGAFAALATLVVNQWQVRRQARMQAFAQALAAVHVYRELPYQIQRRDPNRGRTWLNDRIADAHVQLAFNESLMVLGPRRVARAYCKLVKQARCEGEEHIGRALEAPAKPKLEDVPSDLGFPYPLTNNKKEECLDAMRKSFHHWECSSWRKQVLGELNGDDPCPEKP